MIRSDKNDPNNLYDTIGAPQTEEHPAESKSFDIQHELANGEIKWRREGELLVTELTLAETEPFEFVISFDPSVLKCKEISASDGAELPEAVLQAGRLQFSHAGERRYRITFQPGKIPGSMLRLQMQRNGVLLYDKEILFDAY